MTPKRRGNDYLFKLLVISVTAAQVSSFHYPDQERRNGGGEDLSSKLTSFLQWGDKMRQGSESWVRSFGGKSGSSPSGSQKSMETRSFSGEGDASYYKSKSVYGSKSYSSSRASSSSRTSAYDGGCSNRPESPGNALLRCSKYSGCQAECQRNYQFPNGERELIITCKSGEWQIEGTEWDVIPACEPICLPACQNKGICIAPNMCNCPDNYRGPQCQYESKPCLNLPPLPMNSNRKCSPVSCTVECAPNHQFPDGSTITNMVCKDGNWVPSRPDWVTVPDCEVICKPPCQNGGICLSFNMCQCPQDYRGQQCQFSADNCGPQKLGFNGGYNCTSSGTSYTCALSCPAGVEFEFPPVPFYSCDYATGVFSPSPIPQCKFGSSIKAFPPFGESSYEVNTTNIYGVGMFKKGVKTHDISFGMIPQTFIPDTLIIEEKKPRSGSCFTWGNAHYKTFDGKIFDFTSPCLYTFVRDASDNTFSVSISNSKGCDSVHSCYRNITVFLEDREYVLATDEMGDAIMALNGFQRIAIPSKTRDFTVESVGNFIILNLHSCGVTIRWNTKDFVQVDVTEKMWNKTAGLCGRIDGHAGNDLEKTDGSTPSGILEFANSWEVHELGAECTDSPSDINACSRGPIEDATLVSKAEDFCQKLLINPKFAACRKVVNALRYYEACKWDYCACEKSDSVECGCQSISVYVQECVRNGVKEVADWRDEMTCPIKCDNGKIYSTCGPAILDTCGTEEETVAVSSAEPAACIEGCFCPSGTVLHNEKCIPRSQCPCQLRGKQFPPGEVIPSDCNTCSCTNGKWVCTQVQCGARCASIGDPHYTTFDGRHYNFMGKCSYYLVKGNNYSIEAENVACAGSISEAMNFPTLEIGLPSCTKMVTIHYGDQTIKLKQNREVSINGEEIMKVPLSFKGIKIRMVSSIFLLVELPNGLEVWWDGMTRAYVDAPAHLQGKTKGLCGTFNQNQKDDFLTPEGDVEQSAISFANKWKTSESCADLPEKFLEKPCDVNVHKKAAAESHCQKLKGNIFQICHWLVDPEPFYQDCLYDMCSCEGKIGPCLCPILSAYAKECAKQGLNLDWRMEIRECGIHCPGNQRYQVCGNTCTRSCFDIASRSDDTPCKRKCAEGCNCPEGETLNSRGECIPISACTCLHQGLEFQPGHKLIMPGARDSQLCICKNAQWDCHHATSQDMKDYLSVESLRVTCSAINHEEFTDCEPVEPVTCKNMHKPLSFNSAKCTTGCKCKKGYVLDTYSKKCIKPSECPCHHGGRSYGESEKIQEDCNTCTCYSGKWNCTESVCAGVCSAWGESHFKTFDGKIFDFHGSCDYIFAKGKINKQDSFEVMIQNVPCGSSGIACSKAVSLKVGSGENAETITFSKDQGLPPHGSHKRITIRQAGLFVFAEVADIGIVLQWDKGTRIYVKANPSWKNKIRGLCGNYNDNELDDFMTPSGGISEISPVVFGDSWKVHQYCPETYEVKDTCTIHPSRKVWALQKCGILKSEVFQPCHSEVPLDPYLERCIFDTCGCDMGGDCECLCTAVASYAQECNMHGVPIRWRSQELCPMQCDENCAHYSPCVQTCPQLTCDNQYIYKSLIQLCHEDSCVEGCELKPCPEGEVYMSLEDLKCVPLSSCKTVCMTIGNQTYFEGDKIEGDDCHSCYCSRHEKICKGKPCPVKESTTPEYTTMYASTPKSSTTHEFTTTPQLSSTNEPQTIPGTSKCITGWSPWISNDRPEGLKKPTDVEEISTIRSHLVNKYKAICEPEHMTKIECRVVGDHTDYKATGQNVLCSLETGLICDPLNEKGKLKPCFDYEIRVFCLCDTSTVPPVSLITGLVTDEESVCITGWSPWFSNDKPVKFLKKYTDLEKIPDRITSQPHANCERIHVAEIECRTVGTRKNFDETGQNVKCNLKDGLMCLPSKGSPPCVNYEIRVFCSCEASSSITPASPASIPGTSPILELSTPRKGECITGWSPWFSKDKPVRFSKKFNDIERIPEKIIFKPDAFCERSQVAKIECRTVGLGRRFDETDQNVTCNIEQGLICQPSEGEISCLNYEIRVFCSCEPFTSVTTSTPASTSVSLQTIGLSTSEGENCITGWSEWISNDRPVRFTKKFTDIETIPDNVSYKPNAYCERSKIADIQCRVVGTGKSFHETGQSVRCNIDEGLVCNPSKGEPSCLDYEIRVLCSCEPEKPTELPPSEVCEEGLGMESGTIKDDQISVSSISTPGHLGNHARLNENGAWIPESSIVPNEWIQVDLLDLKEVTGVKIQGNPLGRDWVKTFEVKWSEDGEFWNTIRNDDDGPPKEFQGNHDAFNAKKVLFDTSVFTRYIKIIPTDFHNRISLRLEILGCDIAETTTTATSKWTPEVCDPAKPNSPHKTDCYIFYHCADTLHGVELVEKTCGPHMMYNPDTQTCDWPETVNRIRPDCSGIPPQTTGPPLPTVTPCEEGWTEWINVTNPKYGIGDFETLINIRRHLHTEICGGIELISDIECRYMRAIPRKSIKKTKTSTKTGGRVEYIWTDYKQARQIVTCNKDIGLSCYNYQQRNGLCMDYSVRFLCRCEKKKTIPTAMETKPTSPPTTPICPPGKSWKICNINCDQVCLHFDHVLRKKGLCSSKSECISGCMDDYAKTCPKGFYWRDYDTCLEAEDCTCVSHSGQPVKPGDVVRESNCELCQCENNVYSCKDVCKVSTVYASTASPNETKTTPSIITVTGPTVTVGTGRSLHRCNMWTNWQDESSPEDDNGDFESIKSLKMRYEYCTHPSAIECVTVTGNIPSSATGNEVTCDLKRGLVCYNRNNMPGGCEDYKIRLFCPCETTEHTIGSGETIPTTVTTIITSSVTPPPECARERFIPLINGPHPLSNAAFSASSSKNPKHGPHSARLQSLYSAESGLGWIPAHHNKDQFLQVDLGKHEPIYGIKVQGSEEVPDMYVTSYHVLHSEDGHKFKYAGDVSGNPKLFRGPVNNLKPVEEIFVEPFEAKYIKINPQSWKNGIALRLELIGCGEISVTTTPWMIITTPAEVICRDEMGLENGMMNDEQIEVSSVFNEDERFSVPNIRPNKLRTETQGGAWIPATNSINEWVKFDFLEPRNLTGVITQGQKGGISWVESFKVMYSHDGKVWNPVLGRDGAEKEFAANFDGDTPQENYFDRPIQAQFLKIIPLAWHNNIAMRVEVLGCFHPYPPMSTPIPPLITTFSPERCTPCPNLPTEKLEMCVKCLDGLLWDGAKCVNSTECQCYVGHIPYSTGAVYKTEDCKECVCKIGGVSSCNEIKCPKCEKDMIAEISPTCGCICKPCPVNTRICPTTEICIGKELWCNGIVDCPDDEINCNITTTTVSTATAIDCSITSCPPGFKPEPVNLEFEEPSSGTKGIKGKKGFRERVKAAKGKKKKITSVCPIYRCIPELITTPCPTPECPDGFDVQILGSPFESCPPFKCVLHPPEEEVCNMNGRSFETFDGIDYNYDICHHILTTDSINEKWSVEVHRNCSSCPYYLIIKQDLHTIILDKDILVKYGQFSYNRELANKIGLITNQFEVSKVGDILHFKSNQYGFWVNWDGKANARIGVSSKLLNSISGLCGYYSNAEDDDRQMPDGTIARTNKEFGDSWALEGYEACEPKVCEVELQNKAWAICGLAKKKPFKVCNEVMDTGKFISQCLETTCACLEEKKNNALKDGVELELNWEDECRCDALLSFVTQCKEKEPSFDLSEWRIIHSCPAFCPPDEVYKDCYTRECEPSCKTLMMGDACPVVNETCFSGCFCADGLVRKGDKCVEPAECRDCSCDCFGDPHYLTFDRSDYTFNGRCTYVAARDIKPGGNHDFQVLAKNGECVEKTKTSCTHAITILYGEHYIHLKRQEEDGEIAVIIDGNSLRTFPHNNEWSKLERIGRKEVTVLIPSIQLEVSYFFNNYAFVIHLPSHLYGDETEGLCGNCNRNKKDDLKKRDGSVTSDVDDFGKSWLTKLPPELGFAEEKDCEVPVIPPCPPLPLEEDPCWKAIMDKNRFGKCHPVLSPDPYLEACSKDICHSKDKKKTVCHTMEAYSRECAREGVCLEWNVDDICPYECPAGLVYHPCGSGCLETCENHESFKNKSSLCSMSSIDGCYCPNGKVWKEDKCVEVTMCRACDEEGHFPGDIWNPSECEECSCTDSTVTCKVKSCPSVETICDSSMNAVKISESEDECCPKYICVPRTTPSPSCDEPLKPECGYGQEWKITTSISGCREYICVCVPLDKCESLIGPVTLEAELGEGKYDPGMKYEIDKSGCCPKKIPKCDKSLCSPPPQCPVHHTVVELPTEESKCCPDYTCSPSGEVCMYESEYSSEEELEAGAAWPIVSFKKLGEKWQDGPCKECTCVEEEEEDYSKGIKTWKGKVKGGRHLKKVFRASCETIRCPSAEEHPDSKDYILKEVPVKGACCPDIVRTACQDEGKIYQVGKEWSQPGEHCISHQCVLSTNASLVIKHFKIRQCEKECDEGWEYQEPPPDSEKCCGQCKQVACMFGGKLHPIGSSWVSSDKCTTYYCREVDGIVHTQSIDVNCPQEDRLYEDFKVEILPIEGSCCNRTYKVACLIGEHELKEGETFVVGKCKKVYCALGEDGELSKQDVIETCNKECQKGWEYIEPVLDSEKCCGECKQVACLTEDNKLIPAGTKWTTNDGCTSHICEPKGEQLQITSSEEKCPSVDDCPPENIFSDKCCKRCNATEKCPPQGICAPVDVEPFTTKGLVDENKDYHGRCVNPDPVPGFKECKGNCHSSTFFDLRTLTHQSNCKCCQATTTKSITVKVVCEDGYYYERKVTTPTGCACNACESPEKIKSPIKSGTKTGYKSLVLKDADA